MNAVIVKFVFNLTYNFEFPSIIGDVVIDPPPRFFGVNICEVLGF